MARLRFKNVKVRQRLLCESLAVLALLAVITAIAYSGGGSAISHARETSAGMRTEQAWTQLQADAEAVALDEKAVVGFYSGIASGSSAMPGGWDISAYLASFRSDAAVFRSDYAPVAGGSFTKRELALRDAAKKAFDAYVSTADRVNASLKQGQSGKSMLGTMFVADQLVPRLSLPAILAPLRQLAQSQTAKTKASNSSEISSAQAQQSLVLVLAVLAALLAIWIALLVTRSITKPLDRAVAALELSATGDMVTRYGSTLKTRSAAWAGRSTGNWKPTVGCWGPSPTRRLR